MWPALLGLVLPVWAGSVDCRPCHPSQWSRHQESAHATALRRAAEHPLQDRFASDVPFYRLPGFRFLFTREGGALLVRADDGVHVTTLPMEWAFGAGVQAVTFVSRVDSSHHLEHAFTYYPRGETWDLTPRHDRLPFRGLHDAMGQALPTRGAGLSIVNCFQCHSTGPVGVSARGEVLIQEAGVHCEACHGAAGQHLKAKATMPKMPRSGREVNALCGRCHRSDDGKFDWSSAWNVRHQPPYLARSACFRTGALSCLTCHEPHERGRRNDAAYYRQRCQTCHAGQAHVQAKTDCVACHMPSVAASPRLTFHNHWIGIYDSGGLRPRH
jgi:hypothetical protein